MEHNLWQALVAEFLGTCALVFIGCVAVIMAYQAGGFAISMCFGLALIIGIYSWGIYSGGHFNPAISFGVAIAGRMNWINMLLYWVAQILGGILAAAIIVYFFGSASGVGASVGSFTKGNMLKAVLLEALLTMFLVITFLFVTAKPMHAIIAGFVVAAALIAGIFIAMPYTGGSLNPARSLGPALFGKQMGSYWIYVVGPLFGALVAALVYKGFMSIGSCIKPKEFATQSISEKTSRVIVAGVDKMGKDMAASMPVAFGSN
jgi:MIP family channel proteins